MNEKNSICPNLWAPAAGLLQGLTVMQQSVYQTKFRNICEVKKRLAQLDLSGANFTDTAVNEQRKRLLASVRIVGQYFKQLYYRQLKNGQLDEMSTIVSDS